MTKDPRKPQSFSIEDSPVAEIRTRKPGAFDAGVTIVPDELDPFLGAPAPEDLPLPPAPGRRGLPLLKIFLAALGTILSVAFGLWLDGLIRDLFTRADWLGYAAIGVTTLGVLALLGMAGREWLGMRRLSAVQALKQEAEEAARNRKPAPARAVVDKLVKLAENVPETAAGRAALSRTADEIIDAEGLLGLAEIELLGPTDRRVRQLILNASKRVSVVTAVSPRALVDLGYVLFEASRLVRAIAEAYGTRPGRLGMIRLFRDVVAHLAVTRLHRCRRQPCPAVARPRTGIKGLRAARRRRRQRADDRPDRNCGHGPASSPAVQILETAGHRRFPRRYRWWQELKLDRSGVSGSGSVANSVSDLQ